MLLRDILILIALAVPAAACGAAPPPPPPAPPTVAPEEEPAQVDESATLNIGASAPTTILVDGKPAGKTPINGYKVAPGKHDVTFVDESGNRTLTVSLDPGENKAVTMDPPPRAIEKK